MELIGRILGWTPANLGVALLAASFASAYLIALLAVLMSGPYDPSWDYLAYVLVMPVLSGMFLGYWMALFLGLIGVWPTWLLRRFHSAWWMWLVALAAGTGAGATVGLLPLLVMPPNSDDGGPLFPAAELAATGAFLGANCSLWWWLLARRVLKRDALADAPEPAASS